MPKPVTVTVPHQLGKAEARRRIAEGFGSIEDELKSGALKMSFKERWEGDRLHFSGGTFGQSVSGHVDVMDDAVEVEIMLPRLMAALAEGLKGKIARRGQLLLEDRR